LYKEFKLSYYTLALPPATDNFQCAQKFKVLGNDILVAEYGQSARFNFTWSEWYRLFDTDSTSCTRAKVETKFRELMLKMHPDKHGASSTLQQCATQASMIIHFGRQLLLEQTQCGAR
jgi:homospermidine synthase